MATADDLVHCPICLEIFDEPRALPCLHTFCNICLQEYINAAARAKPGLTGFDCPTCRRNTPGPGASTHSGWASSFPKNHIIISLLDGKQRDSTDNQENETRQSSSIPKQNYPPRTDKEIDDRFDAVKEQKVAPAIGEEEQAQPQQSEWTPPPPPGHPPHHWPPPPHHWSPPPHHGPHPHHGPPFHHGPPHHLHGPPGHGHPPHHGHPPPWGPPHGHHGPHHGPHHRGRGCHGRGRFHHPH